MKRDVPAKDTKNAKDIPPSRKTKNRRLIFMEKNRVNTKFLVSTALIAAIYVVMTLAIAPMSFGMVQVRFSEMLMLMAFIDKKYAPGLALGCFIANCFSPFGMMDIVFGTTCTGASPTTAKLYLVPACGRCSAMLLSASSCICSAAHCC